MKENVCLKAVKVNGVLTIECPKSSIYLEDGSAISHSSTYYIPFNDRGSVVEPVKCDGDNLYYAFEKCSYVLELLIVYHKPEFIKNPELFNPEQVYATHYLVHDFLDDEGDVLLINNTDTTDIFELAKKAELGIKVIKGKGSV